MKDRVTVMTSIGLMLALTVVRFAALACAQNQTPTNVPPSIPAGWTDPSTGLMWTLEDNGANVNWNQATNYCANLRLGAHSNWRLATIDELQGIYDPSITNFAQWSNWSGDVHIKGNLQTTGAIWSSSQKNASGVAWYFIFNLGKRLPSRLSTSSPRRALCVRRSEE